MVDAIRLQRRARRAYEWSRVRTAALVALVVLPLIGTTAVETGLHRKALLIGGVLLAISIGLRWWHRRGAEDATAGLQAGLLPFAAALGVCRFSPTCPWALAVAICGTAGVGAGVWLGLHAFGHEDTGLPRWIAGAVVALLTGALGCLALGAGSTLGVAFGLSVGTVVSSAVGRRG